MWTMSNSRADRPLLLLAACALAAACTPGPAGGPDVAPDSPRPARIVGAELPPGVPRDTDRPVEVASLRLRRVRGDTLLMRIAGILATRSADSAVAIEVTTVEPLGNLERTASPEIYVDGVRPGDTWAFPPNRLIVAVADGSRLRVGTSISVAWLGDEERTRSRRPIALTREHLQAIQ